MWYLPKVLASVATARRPGRGKGESWVAQLVHSNQVNGWCSRRGRVQPSANGSDHVTGATWMKKDLAGQLATVPSIGLEGTIVLFTPRRTTLLPPSNGASVGHIWVSCSSTFTSFNKRLDKSALCCCWHLLREWQVRGEPHWKNLDVLSQTGQCWKRSLKDILIALDVALCNVAGRGGWFLYIDTWTNEANCICFVFFLVCVVVQDHKPLGLWRPKWLITFSVCADLSVGTWISLRGVHVCTCHSVCVRLQDWRVRIWSHLSESMNYSPRFSPSLVAKSVGGFACLVRTVWGRRVRRASGRGWGGWGWEEGGWGGGEQGATAWWSWKRRDDMLSVWVDGHRSML